MTASLRSLAAPDRPSLADHVDHPSGFLALSPRNLRFAVPGLAGFVAFRRQGRHRLVPGGVHAPEACRADLLDAFLRDSARDGEQVVALQVRARDVALFREPRLPRRRVRVDASRSSCARFSFAGTKRMKLRNRIKRARDAGVTVVELGRDRACPPGLWRRLDEISRAWLATKGGHELDLLVGEMGEPGDPDRRRVRGLGSAGAAARLHHLRPGVGRAAGRPARSHPPRARRARGRHGADQRHRARPLPGRGDPLPALRLHAVPGGHGRGRGRAPRSLAGAAAGALHRPLGPRDLPGAHAAPVQAEVGARDRRDRVHRVPAACRWARCSRC